MKRALVVGAGGFVGGYLCRELRNNGYEVFGGGRHTEPKCDLLDLENLRELLKKIQPNVIFNLAAQSSVKKSWQDPAGTFDINVKGSICLLEAVRTSNGSARVVLIGSSEQYGIPKGNGTELVAFYEEMPLAPQSPYGISKCTQEELGKLYARVYGMDVVMTRSFNHIGVGQPRGFVIPDLICGIVDVEQRKRTALSIGNLAISRDFTDVRDVVRAYRMIAEKGVRGETYNVGSGRAYCLQDLLNRLIAMARCEIPVQVDPERMRPADLPYVLCSPKKIEKTINWKPEIEIQQTLNEMLEDIRTNSEKG